MTPVTIILLAVIVAVVFIDLYLKRKNKLATTKDIEKVIDKEHPEKKEYNKPVVIVTATLLLLIGLFFTVNHLIYEGRLTNTDDATAYFNSGNAYANLENYEDAIADYTRAIRIDPDYATAYVGRGVVREFAGLAYCSDYKRACDLGEEQGCEYYYKQCR